MAQSGFTPISIYYSATASSVPLAANLVAGELALNTNDGKLYYKNSSNVVTLLAGATSGPAGGSNTQIQFNSSGVLAGSASLTWNGTTLSSSSITNTGLTSGRVVYSTTGGLETDSAGLTFDGTNFATTGTATAAKLIPTGTSVTGNGLYLPAANALGLSTNGTNAVYIDSSQNVGIGTTAPSYRLDVGTGSVTGNIHTYGSNTSGTLVGYSIRSIPRLTNDTGTLENTYIGCGATVGNIIFQQGSSFTTASNTERMRIDSSGNVGIGTSSPGYNLQVNSAASTIVAVSSSNTASFPAFRLSNTGTSGRAFQLGLGGSTSAYPGQFYIYDETAGAIRMLFDTSGNVGIGTSSPVNNGGGYATLTINGANSGIFQVQANGTNAGQVFSRSSSNLTINAPTAAISLETSNAERMRIDSSGNVGIGTTAPSTYANGYGPVLVAGASPNFATIQGRTDGPSGSTNGVSYGGSYSTNPINGARMTLNAEGGSGQRGSVSFWTKALDDNSTQPLERMRIDQSGNVGIGTTSPSRPLTIQTPTSNYAQRIIASTNTFALIEFLNNANNNTDAIIGTSAANTLSFYTNGFNERMRIDGSGNLLVGTTTTLPVNLASGKFQVLQTSTSGHAACFKTNATSGFAAAAFSRNGNNGSVCEFGYDTSTTVGSVSVTSVATVYNTTSDYRLKESIVPMTGALAKVAALKPVTYKWKRDGSDGEGFIAHELAEVCPQAVTGVKDAVDADGKPIHQGIDTSFLVATLTAAIQEQQALITSLTARIAALEST